MTASDPVAMSPPRILRMRIRGFRSYGTEIREIELGSPITVIKGDNSQGKTATAEALEFLFTGRSSRRDLFGGAKAEYDRMLANVHLPQEDTDVWVEADVLCLDSVKRTIRRTLTLDYSASSDCESTVTIDSLQVSNLDLLGIPFGEPPLAAPVLLQHNLRYVLSTAPQQRAAYFRALLELTDLDHVRDAVGRAKARAAGLPSLPLMSTLAGLRDATRANPAASAATVIVERATGQPSVTAGLVSVAKEVSSTVASDTAEGVIAELRAAKQQAEEKVFPIAALTPSPSNMPAFVDIERIARSVEVYTERLKGVDAEVARLAPILEAVVGHPHLGSLTEPTTCPVCEEGTLGPGRIQRIREQLVASADMQVAASGVTRELQSALSSVEAVGRALRIVLPAAQEWDDRQWAEVAAHRDALLSTTPPDGPGLNSDESARGAISRSGVQVQQLRGIWAQIKTVVDAATVKVRERAEIQDELSTLLGQVNECIDAVRYEGASLSAIVNDLHEELGAKLQSATLPPGAREVLDLLEHRDELHHQLRISRRRERVRQRIEALGRLVQNAEEGLLDERFDKMGSEIDRWWATLRPDELVRFGGVGRRASGRRYVNLTAELAISDEATPQVRDAVGVFSDSQLNALGLAAFLARQRLLNSPVVVLDDPLPGYDPEHRVTFTLNTLGALLDEGVQVIVCTHDPKLAINIVEVQSYRGLEHYELTLSDMAEGTAVTNETDVFGRYVLEAQDSMASLTVEGRRNAANALRRAAERLAKQIIATGRTQAGTFTRVSEVGDKVLGELIPGVLGFALGNDERGRWNLWKRSLNPSAHDDDVPLPPTLRTVLGDIKRLKKNHEAHWPGGLLK
jgi:hypothetical protein